MLLRPATADDAFAVARVHVSSWRETYRGLVPDRLLDELSVEGRARMWSRTTAHVIAAEAPVEGIVGFVAAAPQRDQSLAAAYDGEILALYVLRSHQRQGLGRRLLAAAAAGLADAGHTGAALWVLEGNAPARAFYEACGGRTIAERVENEGGAAVKEVAYGWPDLSALRI